MSFSAADDTNIRKANQIINQSPEDRYTKCKRNDPFPEIGDALLNSVDIVKYCMTTGMISPFDITKVKGVTYTCHFSGTYFYWEGRSNNLKKKRGYQAKELILRPNSITYLEIEETLRIPDYLIIRYNLQVSHVYKGLLLGTGPIVDPGFVGKLFIPLHNLTSNTYCIQKGAPLITLEFTKVGRNYAPGADVTTRLDKLDKVAHSVEWPPSKKYVLNFSAIKHQPEDIKPGRGFDVYLRKALIENESFKKTTENICVGSSIPEKIEEATMSAKAAEEAARKSEKTVNGIKRFIYGIGIVGVITIIISVFAILNDLNGRIDSVLGSNMSLIGENNRLQEENAELQKQYDLLLNKNDQLKQENDDLKKNAPLLDENNPSLETNSLQILGG